jgi:hypothetical protein
MALTPQQFQQWLEDPSAVRCILVEAAANIAGTETSIYLSNRNYVTKPTDTPPNTAYLPVLQTSVKFTESMSLDGSGSMGYGDISIGNFSGEYDNWLQGAWQSRPVKIFLGDPKFARADFTEIFSGIIADVSSSGKDSINLQLRDYLETLNQPITETLLGNYYKGNIVETSVYDNPNKEQTLPLVFGEVFNITPLLMDPTELEYMVHNGPIERLIEVRDNGVPLVPGSGYTQNLTKGTFNLLVSPAGAITCSVQGDKAAMYNTTVAAIIKHILKTYVTPVAIADSNIDLVNFASFDATHPQSVGIFISGKENILSVCQQLAESLGAQLIADRYAKFKLLKIDTPVSGPAVTDQDIIVDSVSVSQKPEIQATYRLGYCKNYTVQQGLLTGIPAEHKDLLSGEWLSASVTNETAQELYRLTNLPEQKNTLLLSNANDEVSEEAARLVEIWSQQRYVYRLTCTPGKLTLGLGDMITLQHKRFGLNSGVPAQVISTEIDWDTGYTTLEVLT